MTSMRALLGALLLACAGLVAAQEPPPVCWKHSYGRGVGTIPDSCPGGRNDAGLCYEGCSTAAERVAAQSGNRLQQALYGRIDWQGVGPVCWGRCPSGYRDDGAFCFKPVRTYGRGAGYADWDRELCERENPQGCEVWGAMHYPRCRQGFVAHGCCICSPACPAGYSDIGISCAKPSFGRGAGTIPQCDSKLQYDAGLCYKGCNPGYGGVGPVCWGQCPKDRPVDCGLLCGKTQADCANAIIEQVVSVLDVISTIATTITTFGAGSTAKAGAKAAVQSAAKAATKGASKSSVKAMIRKQLQEAGQSFTEGQLEELTKAAMGEDFEWESLDPTGIAAAVAAFNKPICQAPSGGTQQTSTQPSPAPAGPRAYPFLAGRLVKDASRPEVYLVNAQGRKQHVANPAVFQGCGLAAVPLENWTAAQVAAVADGPALTTPQACVAALAAARAIKPGAR